MSDDWTKEQLNPLSMFELAKWWGDGVKLLAAGNAAGLLSAGAALNAAHGTTLLLAKAAGIFFFIGIFAFAFCFLKIHIAMFAHDEFAHATRNKDAKGISENAENSKRSMMLADIGARISTVAFLIGLVVSFVGFLAY